LKEELLSSQKTFEIYRERARVSLKKTAADQKESDEKILQLNETVKTLELRCQESQAQLKAQEQRRASAIQQLREEIEQEKKVGVQLKKKLEECVVELNEIESTQEKLAESIHGNAKTVSCPSYSSSLFTDWMAE
jgi:predicted  nucleic acid-binding Zn-ribbon protein